MYNVILEDSNPAKKEIIYLLKLIQRGRDDIHPVNKVKIGFDPDDDIRLSFFFTEVPTKNTSSKLSDHGFILNDNYEPDYFATAFYMLNSLQEHNGVNRDHLGRFKYEGSYQSRLCNEKDNIVQHCFERLAEKLSLSIKNVPTQFFLSHDIDTVYESIIQDGFNAIKKGRFDIFLQLLFRVAIGKPDWLNMDMIMDIESEYDCRSTFFWLVNKGKVNGNLSNSDYTFKSNKIQKIIKDVKSRGFENGLHKSISHDSFKKELTNFDVTPVANRYHYLKFNIPSDYNTLEESGLKIDASLGFAEKIGFRNNYGLPFNPYNLEERRPFSFLEVPLNVMDTTLFKSRRSSINEAESEVFDFFERNKTNCVLSILWHNNFFSNYKYKGYLPFYKKILAYIRDNNFKTISQKEIIDNYSIKWP